MFRSAWRRSFAILGQRPSLRPGVLRFTAVAGAVAAVALSSSQTVSAASSSSPANSSTKALNIKLYGYATCPFCNKVGSFLDFFQVPYTLVQVNPMYKDELAFSPDYQKVPIVVLNGERLVDSDCIIDRLNSEVSQQRQTQPLETTAGVQQWRAWVNSHLVHVLVSNVYRTPSECLETMSYLSEVESFSSRSAWVAKYGGAVAMYIIAWKIRWQHSLSLTDPRSDFESAMTTWFDALEGREFHGGSTPDLADLSVYGALRSTVNLSTFSVLMRLPARRWFMNMSEHVGDPSNIRY